MRDLLERFCKENDLVFCENYKGCLGFSTDNVSLSIVELYKFISANTKFTGSVNSYLGNSSVDDKIDGSFIIYFPKHKGVVYG